ncbi:MAG: DEAD/DEAH box helicase family protein, partial [Eubacterium sp.]|nr:DEAD/DEAH box helicase family protein [Eubacterium sp.]
MLPEEKARVKIDKQLRNAGWDIVARNEYLPNSTSAVKEALMGGNTESDYLLFIDGKAIAVVEAKREENPLGDEVKKQAEDYAVSPQDWYGLWFEKLIPLVYMANGNKIYFKNMLVENSDYEELSQMHSPKKMLQIIGKKSEYGALPLIEKRGLRDCQYRAEVKFEESLKMGNKKNLAVLATGSGKTYLACLAAYRLLNYTPTKRILFLVDRNNLARQTESEFSVFDRTEGQQKMGNLYTINRLKKEEDIKGDIVISTIQKLFCVLTGQKINDSDEDAEDEKAKADEEKDSKTVVDLGNDLKLLPDYFQLIIVDECHRSIYGKWKKVLDYFSGATVLGLTATPTPEAYAYFNKNVIEEYTYDDSVVDGVNVPPRVYRIITDITAHGGTIENGAKITETSKRTGKSETIDAGSSVEYGASELDRSVVNKKQIKEVLMAYKKALYEDLYPSRERKWEYIPKTLIFAKSDPHANDIVEIVEEVFKVEFENGKLPKNFVKKITYTAGDSNALIRDLRTEKDFRIAVTVTLVATGTDVKPLEVVLFMKDVHSDVLYTQMKGRGCRVISDDKLKEVTPNADTKECYYIVDAVGVTESEKHIPKPGPDGSSKKNLSLEHLLERLAHNEVSDENLMLLRDYCSTINRRYEESVLFGRHLDYFITNFGFAPRKLANDINTAFAQGTLVEYISPSHDNSMRMGLIYCLIGNLQARNKLLEMQRGYLVETGDDDKVLYAGFSKETAKKYIENFEKYLEDHKDDIEALRIIYNSEDKVITHDMLMELRDRLLSESRQYGVYQIWKNYKL